MSTTEDPTPFGDDHDRQLFAAYMRELVDAIAGDPRIPVPTDVRFWSHQHGASVADVDVFVGQVDAATRQHDRGAQLDLMPWVAAIIEESTHPAVDPGPVKSAEYNLAVYPPRPPTREAWSSQG